MATDGLSKNQFTDSFVSGEIRLGFWSFIKKTVGILDSFFVLRTFTAYQYGVYQLMLAVYATLSDVFHDIFASVATNELYRLSGRGEEGKAKRLFFEYALFRLTLAAIPCVFGFLFANALSTQYGPEASHWIRLLSILFIVDALLSLSTVLLNIRLRFDVLASRPSLQKFIQFGFLLFLYLKGGLGLTSIFFVLLLSPGITFLYLVPSLLQAYAPWRSVVMNEKSVLWEVAIGYGKWEVPQLLMKDLVAKVRPWVIKRFMGTESVGYFGIASNAAGILRDLIPARTLNVLLPRFAHDTKYLDYIYARGTKLYVWAAAVLSVVGMVGYPVAVHLLFPLYVPSIPVFYVLVLTVPIFAFTKIANVLLVAQKRQRAIFYYSLFNNAVTIFVMILFAPILSIVGVGFADVVGQTAVTALKYRYLSKTGFVRGLRLRDLFIITPEDKRLLSRGVEMVLGRLRSVH